jgi:hypothetical protein
MFLIDDLLLSPIKGVLWVFREIHEAAQQELAGESDAITAALSELYQELETGRITEAEFDAQEQVLLERLDRLQEEMTPAEEPKKKGARRSPPGKRHRKKPGPKGPPAILG